jgi:aspartate--ammonia ligase
MLIIPEGYKPSLSVLDTQIAIKYIRTTFHDYLEKNLNLMRISAPLYVLPESGENDNLSGRERPVRFDVPAIGKDVEIVHSLAKWKRVALKRYGFQPGQGLFTEMNAIRRDEDLDNTHSIYVDQWDWECILLPEERTLATCVQYAHKLFDLLKELENNVNRRFHGLTRYLPDRLTVLSLQELNALYPDLTEKEREDEICRRHKAVFLTQIGEDGDRAPDYDDWTMNGDLLLYYPILDCALEISSMGVRVDADTLLRQSEKSGKQDRLSLPYHTAVLNQKLPCTIGGGLGQSRICMYFLGKAHIGEVQASLWPQEMAKACAAGGIRLL